jgi:hypothetical protein
MKPTYEQIMLEHSSQQTALLTHVALALSVLTNNKELLSAAHDLIQGSVLLEKHTIQFQENNKWPEL